MKAKVYHGLINRWVFATPSPLGDTEQGAQFLANEFMQRYDLPGELVAARGLPLDARLAPVAQSGAPTPLPGAKGLVELAWRDDKGKNLEVTEREWPADLYVVRKPIGVVPEGPDRDSRIWAEDISEGAAKLVQGAGNVLELVLWVGGGLAVLWLLSQGKRTTE